MTKDKRTILIEIITRREKLRQMDRGQRLLHDPIHALPYYALATLARIKPFQVTFRTLWDTPMTCYLPEGNTFYYYGYCEANLTNFFLRYVRPGMTCIDVGAHVGIYTMLFSELVTDSGQVHSFEPTPWTHALLQKNTQTLKNVHINNNAIAETKRVLTFADYGPGYGAYNSAHAAGAPALSATPHMTEVESVSLDEYCAEHSLTPDIIKIDSEGFEYEVLLGAKALLSNASQPRPLITIEVANGDSWAQNRNDSFRLLKEHQFVLYGITTEGLIQSQAEQDFYEYDNLLFVPQERVSELTEFTL